MSNRHSISYGIAGFDWLLVAYNPDGTVNGYYTERGTLTNDPTRAQWWGMPELAQHLADDLAKSAGWRAYIWAVEEGPPNL